LAHGREEQGPRVCAVANKSSRVVPNLAKDGSRAHAPATKDRRVQKTRRLLLHALGTLLHEKRYDAIVVQEILDRANVGRSTFYAHFRDKDDLLQSAIRDVLRAVTPTEAVAASRSEKVIGFSRAMFEHIEQHMRASKTGLKLRSREVVHARLRRVLEERVSEELGAIALSSSPSRVPRDLLARHLTSTFVVVLEWWVDRQSKLSAGEVDDVFRRLVLPALAGVLD
jgi:AcrR family transcriptional regulator